MADIRKKDLISMISNETGQTKGDVEEVVNSLLEQTAKSLENGDTVDLYGFGKFLVSERAARQGINPATKEKIEIPASKAVKFKIAKVLKNRVNQ